MDGDCVVVNVDELEKSHVPVVVASCSNSIKKYGCMHVGMCVNGIMDVWCNSIVCFSFHVGFARCNNVLSHEEVVQKVMASWVDDDVA